MSVQYNYSITQHIRIKRVNKASLKQEIEESIVGQKIHWMECKNDDINIWAKETLLENERFKLEEIIHKHDGEASSSNTVNKKGEMKVAIQEETKKTGGHFQSQTFTIDVTPSEKWQPKDIAFPIPISLLSAQISVDELMHFDEGMFFIAPDTPIGAIIHPVMVGEKDIKVSSTVIENTEIGYWLALFDGVVKVDLGRVVFIDPINSLIKTENSSTENFMPGVTAPVYVLQTVKMVPYYLFKKGNHLNIGNTKIGGSYIPAGVPIRMIYKNNDGKEKKFSINLEYLY